MRTSYFANLKNIKYPIAICRYPPKWYNGIVYSKLAPSESLLNDFRHLKEQYGRNGTTYFDRSLDNLLIEYYKDRYSRETLSNLDPFRTYNYLYSLYPNVNPKINEDDITLICFEKPSVFCHRYLVADWFESNGLFCASDEKVF